MGIHQISTLEKAMECFRRMADRIHGHLLWLCRLIFRMESINESCCFPETDYEYNWYEITRSHWSQSCRPSTRWTCHRIWHFWKSIRIPQPSEKCRNIWS